MGLQCIPFRARHIELINPEWSDEMRNLAYFAQETGPGYTACLYGRPIGAGGLSIQRPGIAEAWTLFKPVIKMFPLWLHSQCVEKLNQFNWLDIYAQAESCNDRWMRILGFEISTEENDFINLNEGSTLYVRRKCG